MREIKFRYVFKCGGRVRIHEYTIEDIEHSVGDDADYYKKHGFELISRDQYTGLKDCNGVNICEGDILSADGDTFPAVVEFDEAGLLWSAQCYHAGKLNELMGLARYIRSRSLASRSPVKVIGNIHENPELLESAKC